MIERELQINMSEGGRMSTLDKLSDICAYLEDEFAMEPDEIKEMIEMMRDSLTSQIADLKTALASGDTETLRSLGHAIKGAAANIGATSLSATAAAIDNPETASDTAKCEELVKAIEENLLSWSNTSEG